MQADIFFFVTTIAVVLVTIGIVVVLLYIIKILSNVRHISEVAKREGDYMAEELADFREQLHRKRPVISALWGFVRQVIQHYKH